MTKMADIPYLVKHFDIFYPDPSGTIRRSLICSTRPNPIVCSIYDTVLTMTYFQQGQISQRWLEYKNVIVMDSLETIASRELEFGFVSKLNTCNQMKNYE